MADNNVVAEQEMRQHLTEKTFVNKNTNQEEWTEKQKDALAEELSFGDYKANVLAATGKAVKVKWYRDNKPVAPYYSRDFKKSEAKKFIKDFVKLEK